MFAWIQILSYFSKLIRGKLKKSWLGSSDLIFLLTACYVLMSASNPMCPRFTQSSIFTSLQLPTQ